MTTDIHWKCEPHDMLGGGRSFMNYVEIEGPQPDRDGKPPLDYDAIEQGKHPEYTAAHIRHCPGCDKRWFVWTLTGLTARRVYCSDRRCTYQTQARQRREERTAARGRRVCVQCDDVYIPTREDARFCSNRCRQKHHRWMHKDA